MNIAICLRGIHYEQSDIRNVNYKKSLLNFEKFIFDNLKENGNNTYTYITTYHTELENELINDFKPNNIILNNYNINDSIYTIYLTQYIEIIDMVINDELKLGIKYDSIIIFRFDLIFFKYINEMNIDYNKFNICMKHSSGNADADFWIIPRHYLEKFRTILINNLDLPDFYRTLNSINQFIDKDIIHYMYNIDETDENNGTCEQYYYIIGSSHSFVRPLRDVVYSLNQHKCANIDSNYLKYEF